MSPRIRFGTDGWRGVIAQDYTFDNVRLCAQGVVNYLKKQGGVERGLIIGYDTRFASEEFAAAAAEVVAANSIRVYLGSRPLPTPVVSFATGHWGRAGAIIITASHNPYQWNGFKFKTAQGCPAPSEVEREIEREIEQVTSLPPYQPSAQGLIEPFDPLPDYLEHLSTLVDLPSIRRSSLKVVIDSMYGAGMGLLLGILQGGRVEVKEIHGQRNPLFPGLQPEPIAANLKELFAAVRESQAKVGLATDGDADRFGVVDEKGEFITPLQVFPLLALYLLQWRGQRGAIVKTLACSRMFHPLAERFDVPVYETSVGFKHVAPFLLEGALIGGEESGGYGFRGHAPERDGILAALYFLDLMLKAGKSPSELVDYLFDLVGPHFYRRVDVHYPAQERQAILSRLESAQPSSLAGTALAQKGTTDGFHFLLRDGSWLLIRFSGTEPLLRLYAEAQSQEKVAQLLEEAKRISGIGD